MLRYVLATAVAAALFPVPASAADGDVAFVVHEPGGDSGFDVVGPDGSGRRALLRESGAYSPAWSPDGRRLAYVASDGLRLLENGVSVRLEVGAPYAAAPAWSPDGTRIAFHADGDVHVAHLTANPVRVERVTAGRSPAWSPDGTRLAFVGEGALRIIAAGGGTPATRVPAAEDPTWSPDGTRIAYAAGGDVWAVPARGGAPERLIQGASQPAWAPSGGRLAYAAGGDVGVLDLASGQTAVLAGGPGSESAPTWAGVRPAVVDARHVGRIAFARAGELYVMNPGGGDMRRLTRNHVVDGDPAWAPPVRGRPAELAFARSGQIHMMRADGRGQRRLTRTTGVHRAPAWSPDGAAIAFTRIPPGGAAEVWVSDAAGERRVSPADGIPYSNPSWSPDGSALAFERVDTGHLIPPGEPPIALDEEETRIIGLGFCTVAMPAGAPLCRDSYSQERAPVWGGPHEQAIGRLVYVARGAGSPSFGFPGLALWSTDLVGPTVAYRDARWSYDARINAEVPDPADPSVAADGSGLVVSGRHEEARQIALVRTLGRRPGGPESPTWEVIDAYEFWLARGTQPAWEARLAPLPVSADGTFDRRTRVRGRLRGRRLTLVNRNRFWVTARVRGRALRLPPATRRRATVRRIRVSGRRLRVTLRDTAGRRRTVVIASGA